MVSAASGKRKLRSEYAYRHSTAYKYFILVNADNIAQLDSRYRELTKLLGIPVGDVDDPNEVRHVLRRWLSNESGYLLIFDNADDPEAIRPFFPSTRWATSSLRRETETSISYKSHPLRWN